MANNLVISHLSFYSSIVRLSGFPKIVREQVKLYN